MQHGTPPTCGGCGWMPTGYHSEVSARSLEEEETNQSVRVWKNMKETHILVERGG